MSVVTGLSEVLGGRRCRTTATNSNPLLILTTTNANGARALICHMTRLVSRKISPSSVLLLAFAGGTTGRVLRHTARIMNTRIGTV